MANDLVKRFIKKDGSQRISFYLMEYAENPRDTTDEPLHCEDWSREYSIMTKDERQNKSRNARALLEYFLVRYGDKKKMLAELKANGKKDEHENYENSLIYNRHEHEWILYMWMPAYKAYDGQLKVSEWEWQEGWGLRFEDLDVGEIMEFLSDETIMDFAGRYLNDKVKIMSYSFGYYGGISFDNEFSTDSEGICWLEKDEFLKYSGCKEEYWKEKSLDEIEWLLDELKAWGDNDVYGFVVEDAFRIQGIKTYYNGEREDEPYIDTQWEESESVFGFYGELDTVIPYMFEQTNLKQEDFEEVA